MPGVADNFSSNIVALDFFKLMVGEKIGEGCGRTVFVSKMDPDVVLKFETEEGSFKNAAEWRAWETLQHDATAARWLAPCIAISACGTVLLQKRTAPLRRREMSRYPKLPGFLTDVKMSNFGMLDGKLVCHDYGFMRWGYDTKLIKADWVVKP